MSVSWFQVRVCLTNAIKEPMTFQVRASCEAALIVRRVAHHLILHLPLGLSVLRMKPLSPVRLPLIVSASFCSRRL